MSMPNLHWNSYTTTAFRGKQEAFGKAKQIMLEMKLQNVRINEWDVNGGTSDTFMAVTFIQLDSKRFVAMAMSSGTAANSSVNDFIERIKKIVRIDEG
jgi:hypothetical protein